MVRASIAWPLDGRPKRPGLRLSFSRPLFLLNTVDD